MEATSIPITEIGVIIVVALFVGFIASRLKQSSAIGYIVAGILLGPMFLNFLAPGQGIAPIFGEIGLLMLLFYLGLELSLKKFAEAGPIALILMVVSLAFTFIAGFLVANLFGYTGLEAIVIGSLLPMASTVIIVKYILEKNLLNTEEARIAISVLIIEDFLGILILVFLSSLSSHKAINILVLNGLFFVIASFFVVSKLSSFLLNLLNKYGQADKMALYGIGVGIVVAYLGNFLGLSPILGAYFAGFALAETPHGQKIKKELSLFREFFVLFFFVSFGSTVIFPATAGIFIFLAVILVAYIVAMVLAYGIFGTALGMKDETAVGTALLGTPIGEFSLIIALAAAPLMPRANEVISLAFLLTLTTTMLSQYLFEKRKAVTQIFTTIYPQSIKNALSVLGKEVKVIEQFTANPAFQSEYSRVVKNIAGNLFIAFSIVYVSYVVNYSIDFSFLPFLSNRVSLGLLVFPLIVWPLYKVISLLKYLIKKMVDEFVTPYVFSQKTHKSLEIAKQVSNIFVGVILTLFGAGVTTFTYVKNYDLLFLLLPATFTLISLIYLSKSFYALSDNFENLGDILAETKDTRQGISELTKEFDSRSKKFRELLQERSSIQEKIQAAIETGNSKKASHLLGGFKKREKKILSELVNYAKRETKSDLQLREKHLKHALLNYFKKNPPKIKLAKKK